MKFNASSSPEVREHPLHSRRAWLSGRRWRLNMEPVTAKELATKIVRPEETILAAMDRIRNWTRENLIQTVGDKNPGTGHSRKYQTDALKRVVVLELLSRLGCRVAGREDLVAKILANGALLDGLARLAEAASPTSMLLVNISASFEHSGIWQSPPMKSKESERPAANAAPTPKGEHP